jgi:hypothetical protein
MKQIEKNALIDELNRKLALVTSETSVPTFNDTVDTIKSSFNNSNHRKKRQLEELLKIVDRLIQEQ